MSTTLAESDSDDDADVLRLDCGSSSSDESPIRLQRVAKKGRGLFRRSAWRVLCLLPLFGKLS